MKTREPDPKGIRAKWCCMDCDGKRSVERLHRRMRPLWRDYLNEVKKHVSSKAVS